MARCLTKHKPRYKIGGNVSVIIGLIRRGLKMPYRNQWFDAPKDMSLTVHKELPEGVEEDRLSFIHNLKEASGYANGQYVFFHFCRHCGGWIEGHANSYEVNTLNSRQLSGMRGTEFHCLRCGERLAFSGIMS